MKFCKKGGDKLIVEKTFTVETRLNQKQNQEIIDYAREFNALYSKVLRFAWHRYNKVVTSTERNLNLTLFCRKGLTSIKEWQTP